MIDPPNQRASASAFTSFRFQREAQVFRLDGTFSWEPFNPPPEEYLSEPEFLAAAAAEREARKAAA